MSEHATSASSAGGDAGLSCLRRHHFLLRRLHSLSGIVPVGLFVMFHLFTNMQMMFGTFQHEVEFIHNMPALLFIEIFGLWLPIAFHAGLGLVYTFTGVPNTTQYRYADNWRYTLQRVTGILALIFIFVHVAKLRWGWSFAGLLDTPFYTHGPNGEPLAHATTAMALQHAFPWVLLFYIVGVYSVVFHWANGLWTAAITWGLTISTQAQRRWGYVCAVVGLTLAVFSAVSIYAAMTYPVSDHERAVVRLMETGQAKPAKHGVPVEAPSVTPPQAANVAVPHAH